MARFRILLQLLLALALVANGAGIAMAGSGSGSHDHGGATPAASAKMSCHDLADAPPSSPVKKMVLDCCDGSGCSCLHHAPALATVAPTVPGLAHGSVFAIGQLVTLAAAPAAPALRPPIA